MANEMVEVFVLRNGSDWTIMSDGVMRGRFDYKVDAEDAAIRLAKSAEVNGSPSGVMSPDSGSQMRWLWLGSSAERERNTSGLFSGR